jgi:hypothetical protein
MFHYAAHVKPVVNGTENLSDAGSGVPVSSNQVSDESGDNRLVVFRRENKVGKYVLTFGDQLSARHFIRFFEAPDTVNRSYKRKTVSRDSAVGIATGYGLDD